MNACGDVALDRTMCSAVRRRMLEKGTIWSPAARNEAMETGGACGVRATGAAGAAWTGGGGGAAVARPRRGPSWRRSRRTAGLDHALGIVAGDAAA